ncbi:translocation/assembly module TamB domain-containing protein [Candidatus Schneideria nysicola]|uniref:translocation/assembly module TamB domain-containing protein n=1 Tax=Candidatus Schneideria nysicola TaxID=1081631 RepID=UPI001CAA7197|nr:translocation/assembly module TamB domain-containing protein [Candidatus Schneideria nysicola]UAJ65850.1 translocation/assembly module TamB domain-containing protein [Candidatus Schneideria nysicola]
MIPLKKTYFILIISLLLVGTAIFLFHTKIGLNFLINGVIQFIPGLKINSFDGNWKKLELFQISYQIPGINIYVNKAHISLKFRYLFIGRIYINQLSLNDTLINIKRDNATRLFYNLNKKNTIFSSLLFNKLLVKNLKIQKDNILISVNRGNTSLMKNANNQIVIGPTYITDLFIKIKKEIFYRKIDIVENTINKNIMKFSLNCINQYNISKILSFKPLVTQSILPTIISFINSISLILEDFQVKNLHIYNIKNNNIIFTKMNTRFFITNQCINLVSFNLVSSHSLFRASGKILFNLNKNCHIDLHTHVNFFSLKKEEFDIDITGDLYKEICSVFRFYSPMCAKLIFRINFIDSVYPITVHFFSDQLKNFNNNISSFLLKNITFKLSKRKSNYFLILNTLLVFHTDSDYQTPPIRISICGNGNKNFFTFTKVKITSASNYQTQLKFLLNFNKKYIIWNGKFILNHFIYHNKLGLPFQLQEKYNLKYNDSSYTLENIVFDIKGNIKFFPKYYRWDFLFLKESHLLRFTGKINHLWEFNAHFYRSNHNKLKFTGYIKGKTTIYKEKNKYKKLFIDIDMKNLKFSNYYLKSIFIEWIIYYKKNHSINIFHIVISQLQIKKFMFNNIVLKIIRNINQQSIQLAMDRNIRIKIEGNFNNINYWFGVVNQQLTYINGWILNKNSYFYYRNNQFIMSSHSWKKLNAYIFIPNNIEITPLSWIGTIFIKDIDLSTYNKFLSKNVKIIGKFSGKIELFVDKGLLSLYLSILGNTIEIHHNIISLIKIDYFNLNGSINLDSFYFNYFSKVAEGYLTGVINLNLKNKNILGSIKIKHIAFSNFDIFQFGKRVNGFIDANLNFNGVIPLLKIYGSLKFHNLYLDEDEENSSILINGSEIIFNFNGNTAKIHGTAYINQNKISLHGNLDWTYKVNSNIRLILKSEHIQLENSILKLDFLPSFTCNINPILLSINGEIHIPYARIELKNFSPNTIKLSYDEVLFFQEEKKEFLNKNSIIFGPILNNLSISLGENVQINALGLRTKLQGNLQIFRENNRIGLHGKIDIHSGYCHFYGRKLIIKTGLLLFSGPIDQPYIYIEAIRHPDSTIHNITAGVRITGLLDQLKINFFSNTAQSKEEAISYFIRGQGLNSSFLYDGTFTSLLIGMGIAQSEKILEKFGIIFGMNNLILQTQGVGKNSQLVLSGYLPLGLHIKYGIGIFDSLESLSIRYCLMPNFFLESNINRTIHLLYHIRF